jgi:hypothetical protein
MALTCSLPALIAASSTFGSNTISRDERLAIQVYLMMAGLAAAGGNNYTASIQTLQQNAESWYPLNRDQRNAIGLYIEMQNAVNEGASITQTVASLRNAAKCLVCIPPQNLEAIMLFLQCQLNALNKP